MSYIGNSPGNASQRVVTQKVATAGQTRFASDSGYATGYVDVIVNGSDLVAGVDFNETGDGINIDIIEPCAADDNVKIVAWIPRGLSDGYTKPEANALLALKADLVAGKIPSSQLPAYVDDVLEYANLAAFPATGSAGIIYVAQDTNNCYRWSGSAYIVLTDLSSYYTKTQSDALLVPSTVSDKNNTSTGYFDLPSGTTAQRPASPTVGMTRFNTDLNVVEAWHTTDGWVPLSNTFQAVGGVETTYSSNGFTYKSHTFNSSGTFTVQSGNKSADLVVLAGGGGGGGRVGSGGGAGGLIVSSQTLSLGSYSIVIGAGGVGGTGGLDGAETLGSNGVNTTAFGLTAIGGGGGVEGNTRNGYSGGSGSGGGYDGTGGAGTSGQGNAGGGSAGGAGTYPYKQGGGGGAGAVGGTGSSSTGKAGDGGVGVANTYANGTSQYYAGGGGGGSHNPYNSSLANNGRGMGGNGGGGNAGAPGGKNAGSDGSTNFGGGGGGASTDNANSYKGGNGGSGVVIIRYRIA